MYIYRENLLFSSYFVTFLLVHCLGPSCQSRTSATRMTWMVPLQPTRLLILPTVERTCQVHSSGAVFALLTNFSVPLGSWPLHVNWPQPCSPKISFGGNTEREEEEALLPACIQYLLTGWVPPRPQLPPDRSVAPVVPVRFPGPAVHVTLPFSPFVSPALQYSGFLLLLILELSWLLSSSTTYVTNTLN